jgi:hypothetical protein
MLAGVQYRIPVAQIYRAGNDPLLDSMIARFRGDAGELIPKGTVAARRAIATLRRGIALNVALSACQMSLDTISSWSRVSTFDRADAGFSASSVEVRPSTRLTTANSSRSWNGFGKERLAPISKPMLA